VHLGLIGAVQRQQFLVGIDAFAPIGIDRVVTELLVFDQMPENIDAKTIDAALQPKPQHVEHRLDDLRVAPVQVGLLAQKRMIIVLLRLRIVLPCVATKA